MSLVQLIADLFRRRQDTTATRSTEDYRPRQALTDGPPIARTPAERLVLSLFPDLTAKELPDGWGRD